MLGLLALPYYLVIEGLSPFIEAIGFTVILLGLANGTIAFEQLDVLLTAYMFGAVCTLVALLFDEIAFHTYRGLRDRMLLVWFAFLEQVVYRPLTIVWRLWGFALWAQGRSEWGQMERTSFETAT